MEKLYSVLVVCDAETDPDQMIKNLATDDYRVAKTRSYREALDILKASTSPYALIDPRCFAAKEWDFVDSLKQYVLGVGLTVKQFAILERILKGESNKIIATDMNISEQGVKYHVGILLKRFRMRNRRELQKHFLPLMANRQS